MIRRLCRGCSEPFTIDDAEIAYLERVAAERGWRSIRPPWRCVRCRGHRRARQYGETFGPAEVRTCVTCSEPFEVSEAERGMFAAAGFQRRRRCERCLTSGRR